MIFLSKNPAKVNVTGKRANFSEGAYDAGRESLLNIFVVRGSLNMQGGGPPYEKVNARKLLESESRVQGRKPPHAYVDVDRKQLIDDRRSAGSIFWRERKPIS